MKFRLLIVAASLAGLPAVAHHQDEFGIHQDEIAIDSVVTAGTGCPIGSSSADVRLEDGGRKIVIQTEELEAVSGHGLPLSLSRRNCQVALSLRLSDDLSYAVKKVRLKGDASIRNGGRGLAKSTAYFQGQTASFSIEKKITHSGDFVSSGTIPDEKLVFSPCGGKRALNLNTEVRANGSGSVEGEVQIYELAFRRCE